MSQVLVVDASVVVDLLVALLWAHQRLKVVAVEPQEI